MSGGSGPDQLRGGQGDDRYFIAEAEDRIVEGEDEGNDRILASVSYALRAGVFVETLATGDVAGTAAIDLTGNEVANTVNGNAGNNVLKGGGGNDILRGYAGDDRLDGGIGADTMFGGLGNDLYVVDAAGDKVSEFDGEGDDRVLASVSYALRTGASIETLMTTSVAGTAAINLTGNEIANAISGNAGDNVLKGGAGDDTLRGYAGNDRLDGGTGSDAMIGGLGDDIYYVDAASDRVSEAVDEGDDRVLASASYVLRAGVSVETLATTSTTGTAAIDLTGNEIANAIAGNAGVNVLKGGGGNDLLRGYAGNDTLDGGTGADTMVGGLGDDTYSVDAADDIVREGSGEGTDHVIVGVDYTLAANASIEILSTKYPTGGSLIDITGNGFDNAIYGNIGRNVLDGGAGDDFLDGRGGADTLIGGRGADTFSLSADRHRLAGCTIADFESGVDRILLDGTRYAPFGPLASGPLGAHQFVVGPRATTAETIFIYDIATGTLLYDEDGSGITNSAIRIANFAPQTLLTVSDIEISGSPNEAPSITSGGTATVTENALRYTIVYQANASDTDGDRTLWSLTGADQSLFTIDRWGTVRMIEPADFEAKNSYSFNVVASDSAGASSTQAVTLTITDDIRTTPVIAETTRGNDLLDRAQTIMRDALELHDNPDLPDEHIPSVTISGSVSSPSDRDSYSIWLAEGEVLYLDVDNSSGNLDSVLALYWGSVSTIPVLSNDDLGALDLGSDPHPEYGHNTDSFLRFRAPFSGDYYFTIESFQDPDLPTSGTYDLHVSVGPPATPAQLLEEDIEALISGAQWDHTDLTYGFPTNTVRYPADMTEFDEAGEFAPLSALQQSAVRLELASIAAVSQLTFSAAANPGLADLRYALSSEPETAHAYYPTNLGPDSPGGTAWFNRTGYSSPMAGNYAWLTFLHETGHALGLKHGHEAPPISHDRDSLEFSIMTYRSYVGADVGPDSGYTNETWGFPTTLMMLDIAALQRMYGANFATNAGDTVYRWSPTTGEMTINAVSQGSPGGNRILMTVWDGGGTDTYNLSNYTTAVTIDLRPGEWTSTGAVQTANLGDGHRARGNVANALLFDDDPRSLIENAIGGNGADTLIANQAANRLTGGGGADVFRWASLDDLVGLGSDTVTDFVSRVDKIDLSALNGILGSPAFDFIGTRAFTESSRSDGELRYEVGSGGVIVYGDNDADGAADFQIRLVGVTSLVDGDFIL